MSAYNLAVLEVLLSNASEKSKQKQLKALAAHARGERKCPECGVVAVHEDNGCTGHNLSWLCVGCGMSWDEF